MTFFPTDIPSFLLGAAFAILVILVCEGMVVLCRKKKQSYQIKWQKGLDNMPGFYYRYYFGDEEIYRKRDAHGRFTK